MKSAAAAGHAAKEAQPLLDRGRDAYRAVLLQAGRYDDVEMLSVDGVAVVTLADFIAHPRICHAYAERVKTIKVLNDEGALSTIMCPDGRL